MMPEGESDRAAAPRPWTAELVKQMLAQTPTSSLVTEARDAGSEEKRQGLRRAAAVMGAFDPASLRGVNGDGTRGEWRLGFAEDCLSSSDVSGNRRWVLKPTVRHETLASMNEADFLEALDANPSFDSSDPIRRMVRRALAHTKSPVPLDGLSASELAALMQVAGWSPLLARGIGPVDEIARRRAKLLLMSPFEALAGREIFAGRRRELAQLRSFVDALASEDVFEAVSRVPRRLQRGLSKDAGGAYVIEAPGGMGKSALVARFILQHTTENPSRPLPFLYLDWEDPTLVATEPETMLIEIARQLGTQQSDLIEASLVDTLTASLRTHRERFASGVTQQRTGEGKGRPSLDDAYSNRNRAAQQRESLLPRYAARVGELVDRATDLSGRPVLLVLDTFERVQRFGRGQVEAVRSVVDQLCRSAPSLRVVIATRAPLRSFTLGTRSPVTSVLGPLDDEAAGTLLRKWGVPAGDAGKLARHVGGSPLSLTLAARIYRQTGLSGIDTIGRHKWLFFSIGEAEVQAALYWRYLDQIDEDLRPLAHPGLILRRIDADVILDVLAAPCGLSVSGKADAHQLFERLKEEVTLIGPNQDGTDAVRHRSDVRRFMLGLMQRDNPDLAKLINQRAIDYYAALSDRAGTAPPWARAEEIYHRLLLGEDVAAVDARWVPGLGTYLQEAVDELPIRSKIFLANKLGLSLQEDDRREASLEEQELSIANEAERFITAGSIETALTILATQSERSSTSPLHRLEARALSLAGRSMEALAKADAAAEAASMAGDKRGLAEMLVLSAELSFRQGDLAHAAVFLEKAVSLCQEAVDAARLVSALVLLVRVYDAQGLPFKKDEAVRQLDAARARMKEAASRSTEAPTRLAYEAAQAADLEIALAPVPSPPLTPAEPSVSEAEASAASSELGSADPTSGAGGGGASQPEQLYGEVLYPSEDLADFDGLKKERESLDQLFTNFNKGLSS